MKKTGVIFFVALVLILPLVMQVVKGQAAPGLPPGLEGDPTEIIENLKKNATSAWDYLGKEWKFLITKNKYVAPIDNFLSKNEAIQFGFLIILGEKYEFTLTFFVTLIVWVILLFLVAQFIDSNGFVKGGLAFVFSACALIILSQFHVIRIVIVAIGTFIFSYESKWARSILTLVAIGVFIAFVFVSKVLSEALAKKEKKNLEKKAEQSRKEVIEFNKTMKKTIKDDYPQTKPEWGDEAG